MKPFAYYTSPTLSYPHKDDYTTVYAYLRGQVLWQGSARDWAGAKGTLLPNHTVEKVLDEDAFRAATSAYNAEKARLQLEFKRDLIEDESVTGHPKAEACYALAWQYGHANGLADVEEHFCNFVELIKG